MPRNPLEPQPEATKAAEVFAALMSKCELKNDAICYEERLSLENAIELGKLLNEAKPLCKHGEWLRELAKRRINMRRAQYYMAFAKSEPGSLLGCDSISDARDRVKAEDEEKEPDAPAPDDGCGLSDGDEPEAQPASPTLPDDEDSYPNARDDATPPAPPVPAPGTNKGKILCRKCKKFGEVKGCQMCKDLRETPKPDGANGREVGFDTKDFNKHFGYVVRARDDMAQLRPEIKQTPEYAAVGRILSELNGLFKTMQKLLNPSKESQRG